ncbi:MAG: spore germination protein [Lachnospiraceae bacterium]
MEIESSLEENKKLFSHRLQVNLNFDIINRDIIIGKTRGSFYFIDGMCKDDIMQRILEFLLYVNEKDVINDSVDFITKYMPYIEVDKESNVDKIETALFSGQFILLLDKCKEAILIDARTYPARGVSEPDKDKTLRGSKDGFVETICFNTALIRRRIRDANLTMEMIQMNGVAKTDIVLCYMKHKVNQGLLQDIRKKLEKTYVGNLSINEECLGELLYQRKWYNPFPKFRYSERPDTTAAQILEGNIVILIDNSPYAMILPVTLFSICEEADDYYFPPITATYLRLARFLIFLCLYLLTPTFLLGISYPNFLPEGLSFILIKETVNVPVLLQFLILEIALDGLRVAAINTPSMLSTPLSVMAALILGEFSVNSGWFNSEVMLYMAFVAIGSYTQTNYELNYAVKFMRIITLCLTAIFGIFGYIAGVSMFLFAITTNKTFGNQHYLEPLIPFDYHRLKKVILRKKS